ncbi:MAG: UPF0182 family protein, partial [Acidobacteriota bacterium]
MRQPARLVIFAVLAVLAFVLPNLVEVVTDWWWFGELGQQATYATMIGTEAGLGAVAFAISLAWLTFNLRVAARTLPIESQVRSTPEGITVAMPARREVQSLGSLIAAGAAVLGALFVASSWQDYLGWRHAETFGSVDPILGFDVSFYVFTLPMLELMRSFAVVQVGVAAAGSGVLYLLGGQLAMTPFGVRLGSRARRHLGLLAAAFLVLLAVGAWLDRPNALLLPTGIIRGAGYTDVHARLPFALAEMAAALIAAACAVTYAFTERTAAAAAAIGVYAVVALAGQVYAGAIQRFVVSPNEQVREAPYIQYNIDAT